VDLLYALSHEGKALGVDALTGFAIGENLAGEFEQNTFEFYFPLHGAYCTKSRLANQDGNRIWSLPSVPP
jgi:hypothetical protein